MRTCRVKDVFEGVIRMRGWDPQSVTVNAGERARVAELVSDRLRSGWEYDWWPELMWIEQRRFAAAWDVARDYAADDVVFYDSAYWQSQAADNLGNTPAEGSTFWAAPGEDWLRLIRYRESGQREIGGVDVGNCLFREDPRLNPRARPIEGVMLHYDGILAPEWAPMEPWVSWRRPAPEVSWTEWAAGTGYVIGDLAFRSGTGVCYRANAATTGEAPESHSEVWVPVQFPDFLRRYVVHGAFADGLLEREERYKEDAFAERMLEELADRMVDARVGRQVRFSRG